MREICTPRSQACSTKAGGADAAKVGVECAGKASENNEKSMEHKVEAGIVAKTSGSATPIFFVQAVLMRTWYGFSSSIDKTFICLPDHVIQRRESIAVNVTRYRHQCM